MRNFEFAIIADGIDTNDEALVDRFYEAGCSDALITVIKGNVVLDFTREAESLGQAVASALRDVHRAGARARRIEPDSYVTISDIAERSGLTRQAVSLYASGERGAGDFPRPVLRTTTESPLWDWLSVARWLHKNKRLDDESLVFAELTRDINLHFECVDVEPVRQRAIEELLATV